jgi:hypothetical protein
MQYHRIARFTLLLLLLGSGSTLRVRGTQHAADTFQHTLQAAHEVPMPQGCLAFSNTLFQAQAALSLKSASSVEACAAQCKVDGCSHFSFCPHNTIGG